MYSRFPDFAVGVLKAFKGRIPLRKASLFPLGITARLTISLIAVALLAAAANMIARDGVSIVRMVTQSPVPVMTHLTAMPQTAADPAVPDMRPLNALSLAVDRYERATQVRAGSGSATVDSEYLAA